MKVQRGVRRRLVAAGENCKAELRNQHTGGNLMRRIFYVLAAVLAACSVSHATEIHRVVTGLDANDRSTTLFDNVEPLHAGASGIPSYNIWRNDSNPVGFSFTEDLGLKQKSLAASSLC
jgi:hypothetical protein